MQTRELREFCQRRGWRFAGEYVDEGISGSKDSRPELNKLMADAHRRRFDAVVVWRFDRFARSVSHLLRALETFKALGIEFVSLSEQMDTSTLGKWFLPCSALWRSWSALLSASA
jgi:DNA invertase Pin-like site-specific DNA recombinase